MRDKPDPAHEVVSPSWLVSNRHLFLSALADTQGRTTAATGRPEENWHLFAQNKRRECPVPERVLLRLAARCEPPTFVEAHGLVVPDGATPQT